MLKSTCLAAALTITVALSLPPAALAQSTKTSLSVTHRGEDILGKRLALELRETIRASSGYELLSGPQATYRIGLITLDPARGQATAGNWSIVAVTFTMKNGNLFDDKNPHTWYPIYLTTSAITVIEPRIRDTAQSVFAALEADIEAYRAEHRPK